ncbi:MAG: ATP-binding protein [Clostridium saudiense]|nr:ATP-binding protein [Clostridium saudiense]MDU3520190.1 ATP-binding protein [Clostridium saudiense]
METGLLAKTIEKNLQNGLDYDTPIKTCEKCGDPIQKDIVILNVLRRVPIVCSCRKKELEKKAIEDENKEKQIRLNSIFKNSLMDEKFKQCTFENWNHDIGSEKIFNICSKYASNFTKAKEDNLGLMLYGEPGNGKTHAVSCIANYLMLRGIPTICVSINKMLERIKETYSSYGKEGEETVLKSLSNADLLIIDDLGTEQKNEWSAAKIYNIMDSRYRNGLPTIITTNINLKDLENMYQKRAYDRLMEMCTPVLSDGKSIRAQKGKEKTELLKRLIE